jgi:helix-turn-helix protein
MAHEIFSHSSAVNPGKLAVSVSEIASSWNHAQRRRRRSGDTDSQRQPRISDLMRGKIELFSVDTLITMLTHAGLKVDVRVRRSAAA